MNRRSFFSRVVGSLVALPFVRTTPYRQWLNSGQFSAAAEGEALCNKLTDGYLNRPYVPFIGFSKHSAKTGEIVKVDIADAEVNLIAGADLDVGDFLQADDQGRVIPLRQDSNDLRPAIMVEFND